MFALILYGICLSGFAIYSYWLIDPNITFFQSTTWVQFRDWAVYLGYYRRDISWPVYLTFLILLFGFHFYFASQYKKYNVVAVAALIAFISCVAYPLFSHDLFNYLFDARILTHYGLNPYTHTALDFKNDQWTRFMHWTHRSYPYGPTFLPLSLLPSFFGLGKFSLTFFLYKAMNGLLYGNAVYLLNKKSKKEALFFATHPLIIIEGLCNAHNDMIAVSLGLIGIYFLNNKYHLIGRVMLLFSAGIKYITAPLLILMSSRQRSGFGLLFSFLMQIALIFYLCIKMEFQPWYFLSLFVFLTYFSNILMSLPIFFFGLLVSYFPFIRFGDWTVNTVLMKREIIVAAALLQGVVHLFFLLKSKRKVHLDVS